MAFFKINYFFNSIRFLIFVFVYYLIIYFSLLLNYSPRDAVVRFRWIFAASKLLYFLFYRQIFISAAVISGLIPDNFSVPIVPWPNFIIFLFLWHYGSWRYNAKLLRKKPFYLYYWIFSIRVSLPMLNVDVGQWGVQLKKIKTSL